MAVPPSPSRWFGSIIDAWWPAAGPQRAAEPEIRNAYRAENDGIHTARARIGYGVLALLGLVGAALEHHLFPTRALGLLIATATYAGACLAGMALLTRYPAHGRAFTILTNNVLILINCTYYAVGGGSAGMFGLALVWLMTVFLFFSPTGTAQLSSCAAAFSAPFWALRGGTSSDAETWYVAAAVAGVALMTVARAALIDAQRFAAFHRGEALRRSEADLRGIFENLRDVFFRVNRHGLIEMISPSVAQLGFRPDELIGQSTQALYADPQGFRIVQGQLMENTGGGAFELTIKNRHGDPVPVSMNAHVRIDPDGTFAGIEGIIRDISDRKRTEEALRQRQAQLAHVARLSTLGEMAAGVAHELHQPLAAIVNFTSGCERRLRADGHAGPEIFHALEQISAQALRAGEIIRRIRQFIRKEDPSLDRIDVNAHIRNATELCEPDARHLGIDVHLDLTPSLPPVRGNGIQIEQVLLNLIRNGFEAMQESTGRPKRLSIRSTASENGIEVAVSDSGNAIASDLADRAFDPFFSTKPHGLGLGLGISRSIIEEHGGRLSAEVDPANGTTFRFTLPPDPTS